MDQTKANGPREEGKPYQITAGVWMVPCRIDKNKKVYTPSTRPFKNEKKLRKLKKPFSRQCWASEEDEILTEIVLKLGPKQWSSIASLLNIKLHDGLPVRFGKQCRERWLGTLNPEIQKSAWSPEEDNTLLTQQMQVGNRWSLISEKLRGRTENQIKNRWRKLNKKTKQGEDNSENELPFPNLEFFDPWMFFGWQLPFTNI